MWKDKKKLDQLRDSLEIVLKEKDQIKKQLKTTKDNYEILQKQKAEYEDLVAALFDDAKARKYVVHYLNKLNSTTAPSK